MKPYDKKKKLVSPDSENQTIQLFSESQPNPESPKGKASFSAEKYKSAVFKKIHMKSLEVQVYKKEFM